MDLVFTTFTTLALFEKGGVHVFGVRDGGTKTRHVMMKRK